MKITSVELQPDGSSDVCVMSFRDPKRQNPFNVKTIIGLDADDIVPQFYGSSGSEKFYNLTPQAKDIVARVELNPTWSSGQSYSDLRDRLYKMIAASRTGLVHFLFKNGTTTVAKISGHFKKFEASHFSQTPEVQMTVHCRNPYLVAPDPVNIDVSGLNTALTIINDNVSTAPHGVKLALNVVAANGILTISDPDSPGVLFTIDPPGDTYFQVGDRIELSSVQDERYVRFVRGETTTHLANVVLGGSTWPMLFPGENKFVIGIAVNFTWHSISYYPTFWGV